MVTILIIINFIIFREHVLPAIKLRTIFFFHDTSRAALMAHSTIVIRSVCTSIFSGVLQLKQSISGAVTKLNTSVLLVYYNTADRQVKLPWRKYNNFCNVRNNFGNSILLLCFLYLFY